MEAGSGLGDYDIDEATATPVALVYRAHHREQRRPVLVKVLADAGDHSEEAIAAELFRIATLRHPNILPVEHWGEVSGRHYVVTAAEPSRSLADRFGDGRLGRDEAVALLGAIGRALDHAHESGAQHGGLQPAAVRLADDGTPLVADFGLARPANASAEPAADVRAFAAIAYQALTGIEPFEQGDAGSQPAPPSDRDPELPAEVDEVLLRGLSQDPGERWPSCGAMLKALQPALAAPAAAPALATPRNETQPRVLVRSRAMLAAAGGVALLAVILSAVLVIQLRGARPGATGISLPPPVPGLLSSAAVSPAPRVEPTGSQRPGALAPSIELSTGVLNRGNAVDVTGAGFDPHGQFLITLDQGGTRYQLQQPTPATANGSFSVRVFVPGQATPGPAMVTACATTASGRIEGCAQQQVSVAS